MKHGCYQALFTPGVVAEWQRLFERKDDSEHKNVHICKKKKPRKVLKSVLSWINGEGSSEAEGTDSFQ